MEGIGRGADARRSEAGLADRVHRRTRDPTRASQADRPLGARSPPPRVAPTLAAQMLGEWVREHLLPKPPRPTPSTPPPALGVGAVLLAAVPPERGRPAARFLLREQFLHKARCLPPPPPPPPVPAPSPPRARRTPARPRADCPPCPAVGAAGAAGRARGAPRRRARRRGAQPAHRRRRSLQPARQPRQAAARVRHAAATAEPRHRRAGAAVAASQEGARRHGARRVASLLNGRQRGGHAPQGAPPHAPPRRAPFRPVHACLRAEAPPVHPTSHFPSPSRRFSRARPRPPTSSSWAASSFSRRRSSRAC